MSIDETYSELTPKSGIILDGGLHDVYTRTTHRVRKALFPEISIEDDSADHQNDQNSIVGSFASPSQLLKNAILDLLSVKAKCERGTDTIPELIISLNGSDKESVSKAAREVYLLSKDDKLVLQLADNENLISALVNATRFPDDKIRHDAVAGLSRISHQRPSACYRIFRTGGILELIQMLQSGNTYIVHYAVTTIHNLLLFIDLAKEETITCGGLEALTLHLCSNENKLKALVADSLYILLLDRPLCKEKFLAHNGPRYLVNILNSTSYRKLLHAVVRCTRSISTCEQTKKFLVSIGTFETLNNLLKTTDDDKIRLAILNTMRNLSNEATALNSLSDSVEYLVILIDDHSKDDIVGCACGILSNLTCNNVLNKEAVCMSVGIQVLGCALSRFPHIEDVTEPALCTLRHCTVRHPLASQAQNQIRFAHQIIVNLLATRRPPIVKAALGLIRNCALSQANLESIISKHTEGDTVASLAIEVLDTYDSELKQDFEGYVEGVPLVEMIEGAISALHQLAKNRAIGKHICGRSSVMNILLDLMNWDKIIENKDELIMREILGLIYQLTKSPDGSRAITSYNFQPRIKSCLNSPHKSIAAYASIILRNMGVDNQNNNNNNNGHHQQPASNRYFNSTNMSNNSSNYPHYNGNGYAPSLCSVASNGSRHNLHHHNQHHHSNQQHSPDFGCMNDGMEPELYNELYNYTLALTDNLDDTNHPAGDDAMNNSFVASHNNANISNSCSTLPHNHFHNNSNSNLQDFARHHSATSPQQNMRNSSSWVDTDL